MKIEIDTKQKTIKFLDEFTFTDLDYLKTILPDLHLFKIIPFHNKNVIDLTGKKEKEPFIPTRKPYPYPYIYYGDSVKSDYNISIDKNKITDLNKYYNSLHQQPQEI